MTEPTRVAADRDLCGGYANCTDIAAEYFDIDEAEGLVVVRRADVATDHWAIVDEAVRNCPTGALSLIDVDNAEAT